MKDDTKIGSTQDINLSRIARKPGRPRAIPFALEPTVRKLYYLGYGYRAIAGILRKDYHLNPDFSTVKRTLLRLGILPHSGTIKKLSDD